MFVLFQVLYSGHWWLHPSLIRPWLQKYNDKTITDNTQLAE